MNLIQPATAQDHENLKRLCADRFDGKAQHVRLYHAPYRLCPLGAHIDHQRGPVSSLATEFGVTLAVLPRTDRKLVVASLGFEGVVTVGLEAGQEVAGDWADYARGAVQALASTRRIRAGLSILVDGNLAQAGLSSSAAVGLGYLQALADANDISLSPLELIELDRQIENDFLGLKNGILDPAAIALASEGKLLVLDCDSMAYESIPQAQPFTFLAVYSGVREPLVGSARFNNRVDECLVAGGELWSLAHGGDSVPKPLGCSTVAEWDALSDRLPEVSQRRGRHFFSESRRVREGATLWRRGDAAAFGQLMNDSVESSIGAYETGCEELVRLVRILQSCDGVYGARFSGAGFRGCCVALVEPSSMDDIVERTALEYTTLYPHYRDVMWSFATTASGGLCAL